MFQALDHAVTRHSAGALKFLESLVQCPSTMGQEQSALEVFAKEVGGLGLEVSRLPFPNGPVDHPAAGLAPDPTQMADGRFQVLATSKGQGPLHLLLNGHMDVVPASAEANWLSPPFKPTQRNGRLFGRGAADMKCGFAVGVLALRSLQDVAPELFAHRRIGFFAAIEEECGGNGTLLAGLHHGVTAREVVVLEPTNLDLLVGGVGVLWVDAILATRAGHAHAAHDCPNAIDLGMQLFVVLKDWVADVSRQSTDPALGEGAARLAVNLGKVDAGDWTSSVPSRAVFSFRVAFPRAWTPQDAEQRLRAVVAQALPEGQATLVLTGFRASGYCVNSDTALVRDLAAAHLHAHGVEPKQYALASTTDARTYLNTFGVPAVCFGATGHDLHGVDESVEIDSIAAAARTLARFILMRFDDGQVPA